MKDDGWNETGMITHHIVRNQSLLHWLWAASSHHFESSACTCCRLIFQSRMYSDCSKQIGIGHAQDNGHSSTGGYPRNIDTCGINRPCHGSVFNRLDNTCNTGGFTASAHLICWEKPVPTKVLIRCFGLLGIYYNKIVLFCQQIHPRTSCKI